MSHTSFFTSDLSGFDLVTPPSFYCHIQDKKIKFVSSVTCNYPSFYCHIQGVNDK